MPAHQPPRGARNEPISAIYDDRSANNEAQNMICLRKRYLRRGDERDVSPAHSLSLAEWPSLVELIAPSCAPGEGSSTCIFTVNKTTLLEMETTSLQSKAIVCPMKQQKDIVLKSDWLKGETPSSLYRTASDTKKSGVTSFQPILLPKYIFSLSHWMKNCVARWRSQLQF